MIGYTFPSKASGEAFHVELLSEIDKEDQKQNRKKSWRDRSDAALKKFTASPDTTIPALWSEIKPVFTRLQHGKCAFCERPLGADEVAAFEQDMEHFRPKKGVTPWPPAKPIGTTLPPADMPTSPRSGNGYRKLPFHELNYVVSCKTCNSRCKANYFPIAGKKHEFSAKSPIGLGAKEQPYLIYPLGGLDDDPESIITFLGYRAEPAPYTKGHSRDRARVSIHFFLLNEPARADQLFFGRATQLELLYHKIVAFENSPEKKRQAAWDDVIIECSSANPFAGCVRAMCRLYHSDPQAARQLMQEACTYRRTMLGAGNLGDVPASPPRMR
jgi:hypothetical protein